MPPTSGQLSHLEQYSGPGVLNLDSGQRFSVRVRDSRDGRYTVVCRADLKPSSSGVMPNSVDPGLASIDFRKPIHFVTEMFYKI